MISIKFYNSKTAGNNYKGGNVQQFGDFNSKETSIN